MMTKKKMVMTFIFFVVVLVIIFLAVFIINNRQVSKNYLQNLLTHKNSPSQDLLAFNATALASANTPATLPQISANDYLVGNLNAKVKMIVYEDLSDNYAPVFNDALKAAQKNYAGQIVLAFRPFLVNNNAGSAEVMAAADCAGDQNKFLEMRELLLEKNSSGKLAAASLSDYAQELNLDVNKFSECLASQKYQAKILVASKEAKNYSVYGAPTLFVNKEIVTGARGFADAQNSVGEKISGLKTIIDKELNSN